MIGKFTFVQIAAPGRSSLEEYQSFEARVHNLAQKINQRSLWSLGSENRLPPPMHAAPKISLSGD